MCVQSNFGVEKVSFFLTHPVFPFPYIFLTTGYNTLNTRNTKTRHLGVYIMEWLKGTSRKRACAVIPGANPTIASYNASVVNLLQNHGYTSAF
jgi:hypothetical protein